jgi:hypothetical protein
MFLLDNKREILLRPYSVKQMDAWVDWFLIQGNRGFRKLPHQVFFEREVKPLKWLVNVWLYS